jgi:hypothetical protein
VWAESAVTKTIVASFCESLQKNRKNVQKCGMFFATDLLSFPATLSPQLHHVLPANSPRSAHQKWQNALQNATPPQQKKLQNVTRKILILDD